MAPFLLDLSAWARSSHPAARKRWAELVDAHPRKEYRKALGERMVQLQADTDLEVWPQLIAWLDAQLRARGVEPPQPPDAP